MTDFLERLLAGDRDAIILISGGYFALIGVYSLIYNIWLNRWPSVIGELQEQCVEGSGVGAVSPSDREYRAMVRYSYTVDGVVYEGDRLNPWLVMATHNLRGLLKLQFRAIKRHGGTQVTVYHHPGKPQKSYLDVPDWPSILLAATLCFGSAGLILSAA